MIVAALGLAAYHLERFKIMMGGFITACEEEEGVQPVRCLAANIIPFPGRNSKENVQ